MNKKRLICICLCACALLCGTLGACSSDKGATADEAITAVTTAPTTSSVEASDSSTEAKTEATTKAEGGTWEGINKEKDKNKTNTRPDNLDVDNANGSPGLGVAKRCTITVGNKGYVKDVGDTFTYVYSLKTPKMIENVQAQLTYDGAMLKVKSTNTKEMFPTLGAGVICNTKEANIIYFNASNIDGYDFTKKAPLITVEFEVINTGGTAVATAIEYMDEVGGETSYVDSFIISNKVEYQEIIK